MDTINGKLCNTNTHVTPEGPMMKKKEIGNSLTAVGSRNLEVINKYIGRTPLIVNQKAKVQNNYSRKDDESVEDVYLLNDTVKHKQ